MRGQAVGAAPGELPAWWSEDGAGAAGEPTSLRAVACLALELRAERLALAERERRAAAGYRRLVGAILAADVAARDDETMVPAGAGRKRG